MSYGIETLNSAEKILYYLWIFLTVFIFISTIISEIYDKIHDDGLPKFRREGRKLIRIWAENELQQRKGRL